MSKKLEQKQARREAEERRRAEQRKAALRRNVLTIGTAILVAGIVIAAIVAQREDIEKTTENVGVAADEANCGEIETPEEQEGEHIPEGDPHAPYSSSPPTSGPHYETPAAAGFYPDQQVIEAVVHNLEHSQIVIWYDPNASQETLDQLELLVDQEPQATLAVPYDEIEAPNEIVLTAWGALQACEKISQEVVDDFRRKYQGQGPEKLVPPFEG